MVAAGFGADNMVPLSGASMSGTLNLQGTPPLVMPSGAAAGYVLTTDGSGNVSPQPPVAVAALVPSATVYTSAHTGAGGEYARVDASAGNRAVTLPTTPANNTTIGVKQIAVSGSYATTITVGTGDALNKTGGSTSYTLTLANQGAVFQYNTAGHFWLVTADNLPLGSLDTRYLNMAGPAVLADKTSASNVALRAPSVEDVVFVTNSGNDTNDGLSWGSGKATIAGALAALGANRGNIHLGGGVWTITSADGNGNAVTLANYGTVLSGAGSNNTKINIAANVTWGIVCQGAFTEVHDLTVEVLTGYTCTYGVGVEPAVPAGGSAENCSFWGLAASGGAGGTLTNAFAVAPSSAGNPDVAETHFYHCIATYATNAGFLVGNGVQANILNTFMYGCYADGSEYGVYLAGAPAHWTGGSLQNNAYDIFIFSSFNGSASFTSIRSEGSSRLLYTTSTGGDTLLTLKNIEWDSPHGPLYNPISTGDFINYSLPGVLNLEGIFVRTATSSPYNVTPVIVLGNQITCNARGLIMAVPLTQAFSTSSGNLTTVQLDGYIQLDPTTNYTLTGTGGFAGAQLVPSATQVSINGTLTYVMLPVSSAPVTQTVPHPASGGYVAWSSDPTTSDNLTAPSASTWSAGCAYFYRVDVTPQTVVNGYVSYQWLPHASMSGSYWAIYTLSGTTLTLVDYTADISANASYVYRTIMNQLGVFGTGSYVTPASGVMYLAYLNVTSGVAGGPYYQVTNWYNNVPTAGQLPPNDGNYRLMKSGGSQTVPPGSYSLAGCTISPNTTWWAVD